MVARVQWGVVAATWLLIVLRFGFAHRRARADRHFHDALEVLRVLAMSSAPPPGQTDLQIPRQRSAPYEVSDQAPSAVSR